MNLCQAFSLLILMPIFSWWLNLHDAILCFVVVVFEAASHALTPLAHTWPEMYLVQGLGGLGICKYALLRSAMSKVNNRETLCIFCNEPISSIHGKVFHVQSSNQCWTLIIDKITTFKKFQCVDSDEIGKVFSLIAVAGAGIPIASSPILRWIYHETFLTVPGKSLVNFMSKIYVTAGRVATSNFFKR